ncbi:MAG: tetraacyldisaccharide 4'-kinase [Acidovorax sp.]
MAGAARSRNRWLQGWLQRAWQTRGPVALALWPLALVYGAVVAVRQALYGSGFFRSEHPGRPVIVVGNVVAGGSGKTPVVIALTRHLQARGLRPGVISRGYGRRSRACMAVLADSPAEDVGDEPSLIARSCPGVPVFVAARRMDAARALLSAHPDTDVFVCDDGLQHLALRRDIEICVFNADGVGNGLLLPAGPLRQAWPRPVDFVLHAAAAPPAGTSSPAFATRRCLAPWAVQSDGQRIALTDLQGQPLHAVAAVAHPAAFFDMLRAANLTIACAEGLPDHYRFDSWKSPTDKRNRIVCTEKDAVKLWPREPQALAVPLQLDIDARFFQALDAAIDQRLRSGTSPR